MHLPLASPVVDLRRFPRACGDVSELADPLNI